MSRTPMPNRRESITQRVKIDGKRAYLTVGFLDADRTVVGEVFLVMQKTGAQERALFDEIARSASKRLQHGESLESVAESWMGTKLRPCGPVEGDERIKFCNGPLDWVGRHLLVNYCGRDELAHVKKEV